MPRTLGKDRADRPFALRRLCHSAGIGRASRYSHVIILGTGSLLPLQTKHRSAGNEAVQARVDKEMAEKEPTLEDARKLLQADTFNHALISEDDVALRHRSMVGAISKHTRTAKVTTLPPAAARRASRYTRGSPS